MDQSSFLVGILGRYIPDSSALVASPTVVELPPFIRILHILLRNIDDPDLPKSQRLITNVAILHDVAFSPKCPILGTGHHFAVFASPVAAADRGFVPVDRRAVNPEVYCLKSPNFTSSGAADSPSSKNVFKLEFYSTILQELRVLLHPQIRRSDKIIHLLGMDFQEDYDDHSIAWPVLLMEYAEYGTLATFQEDIHIDMELARVLLLDVACGIHVLHQCNIIHGDVKSENVLICRHHERKYIARLADFGLSVINPDQERVDHRLLGGTFLWSAPELGSALSVQGLQQADVYSFGLTAWRVFTKHQNPYELILPAALGLPTSSTLNEAVTKAKVFEAFDQLVIATMRDCGHFSYPRQVIEASLSKNPAFRDLDRVILALNLCHESVLRNRSSEVSEAYWAAEEPLLVIDQVDDMCGEQHLPSFSLKPSVLHSLETDLQAIFTGSSIMASVAGWILFRLASSPLFHLLNKSPKDCCKTLVRACHLGHPSAQAIVFRYHEQYGESTHVLDPHWLETVAHRGSYFALKSLRVGFPEKYESLLRSQLSIEPEGAGFEKEVRLLRCCRQGDYKGAEAVLSAGASAFPIEEGKVTPLHWLVSFEDENQINHLLRLLLQNGAIIDMWEGRDFGLTFGLAAGTPLHWAVWHRNIPVVRALIEADHQPELKHLNRAIWLAAGMHFYKVLEALTSWILNLNAELREGCDWYTALISAADNIIYQMPRFLRHARKNILRAFEQTMSIILANFCPSKKDVEALYKVALSGNNPMLLRYMFKHLDLGSRRDILDDPMSDIVIISIATGSHELFELCIENGLLGPGTEHGKQKWKALQVCCFLKQRDPAFVKRLLAIGCRVDDRSDDPEANCTPFGIAVWVGSYDIALLLLEHGADKDCLSGWMGGYTITMELLLNWPDVSMSRLKFLFEEIPRSGFGHVAFWGWPGAGGNLLYALAMQHWSSYTAGYRLGETAKYILSQLADKSCLNKIDKVGATALRMACANGNLEICRALIEAGHDVNLSVGFTPLRNAQDWLQKCQKRERIALADKNGDGGEKRLATTLRRRAEQIIELMISHGAIDRGYLESMQVTQNYVINGQWLKPGFETALELFSGFIDKSSSVAPGTTPLQPTSASQFRVHHGKKSFAQEILGGLGRRLDQTRGETIPRPAARYQAHNCLPWRSDYCTGHSNSRPAESSSGNITRAPMIPPRNAHLGSRESAAHATFGPLPHGAAQRPVNTSGSISGFPGSSTDPHISSQHTSSSIQSSISARLLADRIQDALMLYFLEGGGDAATEKSRRLQAVTLLKQHLEAPVLLERRVYEISASEEYARVEEVVSRCLEWMCVSGVTLVPELSEGGKEVTVYVLDEGN